MHIYRRQYFLFLFLIISSLISAQSGKQTDSITGLRINAHALNIIVMGDWGDQGSVDQKRVAGVMGKAAAQLHASFVITTGDNFYPAGVRSTTDPHWTNTFEKVYNAPSLQIPWFPVLGNHDYIQDPDAQIAYTKKSSRWYMPSRYYDTTFIKAGDSILFVFLDTDPIEKEIRKIPPSNKYPAGAVTKQLQWLDSILSTSRAKWKIVVGHHPLRTGGVYRHNSRTWKMKKKLQPVFKRHRVDMYLCGHDHHLEYLKPNGSTHYVISGAASSTGHVGYLKFNRRFASRKKGFVTLSITSESILLQFIGDNAKVLYSTTITK